MKHLCQVVPDCDRSAMRTRDGVPACMYHPESTPPPLDLTTGRLREPSKTTPIGTAVRLPKQRQRPTTSRPPTQAVRPDRCCPNGRCRQCRGISASQPTTGAPCALDGCQRPVKARGLCAAHYTAQRRAEQRTISRSMT